MGPLTHWRTSLLLLLCLALFKHAVAQTGACPSDTTAPVGFNFNVGKDIPGNDISCEEVGTRSVAQLADLCRTQRPGCVAFNVLFRYNRPEACFKNALAPLSAAPSIMFQPCHGIYIKSTTCPADTTAPVGFNFNVGQDIPGNDISCEEVGTRSVAQLADLCRTQRPGCVAFNVLFRYGRPEACFKNALAPLSAAPSIMPLACHGIYIKANPTGVSRYISESLYNTMLPNRGTSPCQGATYTYSAFISAAASFPSFATSSDDVTNKRELAAFLAQISHETTGAALGGPYTWGLCWLREGAAWGTLPKDLDNYCQPNNQYDCVAGNKYYGRGPIQLSWNYNYGPASVELYGDKNVLLNNPDAFLNDPILSFKTALWFWMTPQFPKPSCHAVMATASPSFGTTTNIINGGLECGKGVLTDPVLIRKDPQTSRIGYFERYCAMLGVSAGPSLSCAEMTPLR